MVNIESLSSLEAQRGKLVTEEFLRSAAERVGRRLNPRDAVAIMRDRCFAVIIEVPLLHASLEEIAESIQRDIASLVIERNARIDATASIGIAKVKRHYFNAGDVIRDAGVALSNARSEKPGTVMTFNRSMDPSEAAIAT
jgi:GGDEF domain-containing protein